MLVAASARKRSRSNESKQIRGYLPATAYTFAEEGGCVAAVYTYPGVYIQELTSPVHTIVGVATSIAAFVGYTARGIDNRAEAVFSFSDFQRLFGGLASNSEVSYAVQQFFQNGGTQAYVVRVPMHYLARPAPSHVPTTGCRTRR